jgi:hypothetical protein
MPASLHLPNAQHPAAPPSAPVADGFSIRLPSAQLGDLIQINCGNRIRGAFRLSSGRHEGYLFFADGRLIHAQFGSAAGLDAVVQMLGLRGGSIEPCFVAWPERQSIDMGGDALLLHAAQRLDEMPRAAQTGVREATTKVVRRISPPDESGSFPGVRYASSVHEDTLPPPRPSGEQLSQLQVAQLTRHGSIQKLRSGATTDLADTAYFSERMAAAIGDALCLGQCRAIALESRAESIVVLKARSIVGTRGKTADLDFILRRVGFR